MKSLEVYRGLRLKSRRFTIEGVTESVDLFRVLGNTCYTDRLTETFTKDIDKYLQYLSKQVVHIFVDTHGQIMTVTFVFLLPGPQYLLINVYTDILDSRIMCFNLFYIRRLLGW